MNTKQFTPGTGTGARKPDLEHAFSLDALGQMSMEHRLTLYKTMETVNDALIGVLNQPRCTSGGNYNAAGNTLDKLAEHVSCYIDAIVNSAREADMTGASASEVEKRACIVLSFDASMEDDIPGPVGNRRRVHDRNLDGFAS